MEKAASRLKKMSASALTKRSTRYLGLKENWEDAEGTRTEIKVRS